MYVYIYIYIYIIYIYIYIYIYIQHQASLGSFGGADPGQLLVIRILVIRIGCTANPHSKSPHD